MESKGNKPDYVAKSAVEVFDRQGNPVLDENGRQKTRWKDLGVAFYNQKSDTFNILLDALPVNSKIILTRPREVEQPTLKQGGFVHEDVAQYKQPQRRGY